MIKMFKKGEGNSKRIFVVVFLLFLIILFSGSFYTIFTERSADKGSFAGDDIATKIDVDQILIKVLIKSKEFLNRTIRVMNIGDDVSDIEIMVKGVEDIVSVSDNSFILKPGQTKRVDTTFSAINDKEGIEHRPDVYIGKLEVVSEGVVKTVPLIVEIESKNILYDMNLNPLARERVIYPGEKVTIEVKLFNLEELKPVNIDMEYFVRDLEGNTIISESETVVVQNQASFFKTISIPENFRSENYVFIALAKYGTSTGTASYLFEVSGVKEAAEVEEGKRKFFEVSKLCNNDPFCWISFYVIILLFLALGGSIYFFVGGWIYNKINSIFSNRYRKKVIANKENEITERERKQKEIIELKKFEMELESKEKENKRRRVREFMHTIGVYKTEEEREEIREVKGKERDRRKREKRLEKERRKEEGLGRKREIRRDKEKKREERLDRIKEQKRLVKEQEKLRLVKEIRFRERKSKLREVEEKEWQRKRELSRLRRIKDEEDKRKEREKRRKEGSARKYGGADIRKKERVERIHGIMHALGLYKTKEELREERKRRRIDEAERREQEEKKAKKKKEEEEVRKRKERKEEIKERKKVDIERGRKRKEEEKKRKRELKLKKRLGKSIALFNVLAKKADKFVEERRLGRVISYYSRMKYVYDKLKIVPLESEGKKRAYSKLSEVYVWICKEKEIIEKRREMSKRRKAERANRVNENSMKREGEERKQKELRKQVEEEKKQEEMRKREEERKRQEEVREIKIREVRNREEERKRKGEEKKKREERKRAEEQRQREEEGRRKREEIERKEKEKERKRLEGEKKRKEEIERKNTEERSRIREIRRRKRKKEFRNILHGIGLYETEEEKRKRLREIKRKKEEREKVEAEKRREEEENKKRNERIARLKENKRRKREVLERKEKEKIRKEEIERYIEKKKVIEEKQKKKKVRESKEEERKIKVKEILRRKVEMFNNVFLEVKDRIKKKDVEGAVDSYERLKLKYNELIISDINKRSKAKLYNELKEAYGLLVEERKREIDEEMKVQRLALISLEKEKEEKKRKRLGGEKKEKREVKESVETGKRKKRWLWGREKDPKAALHKEHKEIEDARTTSGTNLVGEEETLRRQEAELEQKEKEQLKKLEELMKNG
tara:strand:- start:4786 stop:8196 length:3411 start_codon:yes stop_codon:yes gene_type:complete